MSTVSGDYLIIQSATSSGNMSKQQTEQSKNFTKQFMSNDQVRIGLILDSASAILKHSLDQRKSVLIQVLDSVVRPGGSNMPSALKLALDEFQSSKIPNKAQNLIIMVDRKPSKEIDNRINELKNEGVEILFVVFGDQMNKQDIKDLKKKGKVFLEASDSDDVSSILGSLKGK